MKKQCKSFTQSGEQCKRAATLNGMCTQHNERDLSENEEDIDISDIYVAIEKEDQSKLAGFLDIYTKLIDSDVSDFFYHAIDKKCYNAIEVFLEMDLIPREELTEIYETTKDKYLRTLLME